MPSHAFVRGPSPQPTTSEGRRSVPRVHRPADYPHGERIEAGLGTAIPGTWSVDSAACRSRGVEAFTVGTHSIFAASEPRLQVAAHEAVHQFQHEGRTRDAFLGAEGHANAVADRLAGGRRVGGLFGGRGDRVAAKIHDYVQPEAEQLKGTDLARLCDALKLAESGDALTSVLDGKLLYTTPELLARANQRLEAQRAGLRLGQLPDTIGPATIGDLAIKKMHRVDPIFTRNADSRDQTMYLDCGQTARELVGPAGTNQPMSAECRGVDGTRVTEPSDDPRVLRARVLRAAGVGRTDKEALRKYRRMQPDEADAFERAQGINKYAAPAVGEAYTIAEKQSGADSWGFHWATVALVAGVDRVTCETAAPNRPTTPEETGQDWRYEMYGPPSRMFGQTYHDEWEPAFGNQRQGAMTMVARQPPESGKPTEGIYAVLRKIGGGQFDSITKEEVAALSSEDRELVRSTTKRALQLYSSDSRRGRDAAAFLARIPR